MTQRKTPKMAVLMLSIALTSLAAWQLLLPTFGQTSSKTPQKRQLNIVFILADDLGYGDIGSYGAPDIRTPEIDRLAMQGVRFTNFYTNGQECTPTRTALMTGRYQQRVGGLECAIGLGNVGRYDDAIRLSKQHDLGLPVEETSIARMLKGVGYQTAITGKWHLGYETKFQPTKHGFDYAFWIAGGSVDYFHHTEPGGGGNMLYLGDQLTQREGYMTDLIAEEAANFIKRAKAQPFFLYVPFTAPHNPYQAPEDKKAEAVQDEDTNEGSHETYVKMIERLDAGVGKILRSIEANDLTENTIVVFTSDNGGNKMGRNAPFSGGKGGLFEGGIRVPCIVRYPAMFPRAIVSEIPTMTMDLTASLARLAGARAAAERPFDGIDILKEVEGKSARTKRVMYWRARRGNRTWLAARDGTLKYLSRKEGEKTEEYLFDLAKDPSEKTNLLIQRSDEVNRLKALLARWEVAVRHTR